jgi:3-hydroxypropanoate dehydrogenase
MTLDSQALDQIFRNARTANGFTDQPVSDELLRQVYELAAFGPTSMNSQPARYVFVRSPEGKARLRECLLPGNVDKTLTAPVTAIVAVDTQFHEHMPQVWHGEGAREMFAGNAALAQTTAQRNGTLGGAWLIIAARAGPRLRADERLRHGQAERRLLPRRALAGQLSGQPGP